MNIVALDEKAMGLMRECRWKEAIPVLKSLLDQNPDYEHGSPWYDLACCHDELGEVEEAMRCYRRALAYDQMNAVFLGGLASLLYRHGAPQEALEAFSRYLKVVGETSELGEKVRPAMVIVAA